MDQKKTRVEYELISEPWTVVKTSDGTLVRLRIILTDLFRVDGQFDVHGQPLYYFTYSTVTAAQADESLCRPAAAVVNMPKPGGKENTH